MYLSWSARPSKPAGKVDSISSDNHQPDPIASLSAPLSHREKEQSAQTSVLCGKPVEYSVEQGASKNGFLGIWIGSWNNARRLCGALIVQGIDQQGIADVLYVYGGSGAPWKQQRRVGVLNSGVLSFQDDQGSTFRFRLGAPGELEANFIGQSGRLSGTFEKSN